VLLPEIGSADHTQVLNGRANDIEASREFINGAVSLGKTEKPGEAAPFRKKGGSSPQKMLKCAKL
jgi:hypothetical protein